MTFPTALHSCLNAYKIGKLCSLQDLRRKRYIFSSDNSHDEIRKMTHVFESNFRKILTHEKARARELQVLKHGIENEEHNIIFMS